MIARSAGFIPWRWEREVEALQAHQAVNRRVAESMQNLALEAMVFEYRVRNVVGNEWRFRWWVRCGSRVALSAWVWWQWYG